jgi:hypothetical protein
VPVVENEFLSLCEEDYVGPTGERFSIRTISSKEESIFSNSQPDEIALAPIEYVV